MSFGLCGYSLQITIAVSKNPVDSGEAFGIDLDTITKDLLHRAHGFSMVSKGGKKHGDYI